jgi:hypothetical protein
MVDATKFNTAFVTLKANDATLTAAKLIDTNEINQDIKTYLNGK